MEQNQRKEILINENTEKAMEIDSYLSELLKVQDLDEADLLIAHHIMNMYDIEKKYDEHYTELSVKGIEF